MGEVDEDGGGFAVLSNGIVPYIVCLENRAGDKSKIDNMIFFLFPCFFTFFSSIQQ